MYETATEYQLKLIRWQIFATFTWTTSKLGSVASRSSDLWSFFRCECLQRAMKLRELRAVVRWERGEIGDRPHCHALLAGLPSRSVAISNCFAMMHDWETKHGFARIQAVSEHQNPFAYLLKGRDEGHGHRYELRKFDKADRVEVSPAAWHAMSQAAGVRTLPQLRVA